VQIDAIQAKRKKHIQENIKKGNKQRKGSGQEYRRDQKHRQKKGRMHPPK
jgi:hypothetical protein